jgi:phosphoribosylanthranilate isomerase
VIDPGSHGGVKVKICGLRSYEDARAALDLGAWALGFIFYPPSPRFISPEDAARIVRRLPAEAITVGVVVDRSLAEIREILSVSGVRGVQLHGAESPSVARAAAADAGVVIKALRVGSGFDPRGLLDYPDCRILLDAFQAGVPGGTGTSFDWSVARKAAEMVPVLLAGGIHADNVQEALRVVKPEGIDVSSGVESSPGIKDKEKLRRLFRAVNNFEKEIGA